MSPQSPAPKRGEDAAVVLLALPYLAFQSAGRMIGNAFKAKASEQTKPPETAPSPVAAARQAPRKFVAADRVFSTIVNDQQVSLFQYFSAEFIRITCRERRLYKETRFTPTIAAQADLAYDIDGAIQWFRKNGFDLRVAAPSAAKPTSAAAANGPRPAAPALRAPSAAAGTSRIVPANGPKARPFTGIIQFLGEVTRRGREDDRPYSTYAVKLESESGAYPKEFIGEHLADLVSELGLFVGQLVTVRLIGKHHFEVEVDGKLEARSRNHFAVIPHNN